MRFTRTEASLHIEQETKRIQENEFDDNLKTKRRNAKDKCAKLVLRRQIIMEVKDLVLVLMFAKVFDLVNTVIDSPFVKIIKDLTNVIALRSK